MSTARSLWRKPLVYCPLLGWSAGVVWWTGLVITFGSSVVVTHEGERTITVASRLVYAPLVAIPWALVWALVGIANLQFRGFWVPVAAALGTLSGGAYSVATNYFDGWLAILMPIQCLSGTVIGLVAGAISRAVWGWFHGWADSL